MTPKHNVFRTPPEILERRRECVARLRLQGFTERQIKDALPNLTPPVVNPQTGRGWSRTAIRADLAAVRAEWHANATRDIAQHQAEQLALLGEVQSQAWREKNLELVLKTHDRIAKLIGSNAPDRVQVDAHLSADVLAETERRLVILTERVGGLDAPARAVLDAQTPALAAPAYTDSDPEPDARNPE